MDHVAIMKKEWGLIPKIVSGEKSIESRWYSNRSKPWDCVSAGDTIYFKDTGGPITVRARVARVLQAADLKKDDIRRLLQQNAAGLGIDNPSINSYWERFKNKRYAIFVYLEKPEVILPFNIDKKGYGSMSAWIAVEDIAKIRL